VKKLNSWLLAFALVTFSGFAVAGLETGDYIDDLVITNPLSSDDPSQGDDHLRFIKKTVTQSLPGITGAVTSTHTELNLLDGVTSTTGELNILDGVTADKDEINVLDGVTGGTVTASKALVVDGSSALDALTVTLVGATSVLDDGVTATTQAAWDSSNKPATTAFVAGAVDNYVLIEDQKASGTHGGTFTQGDWRTRAFNTEVSDTNNYATLSSNRITLTAGTYIFRASAPALHVASHKIRLQNVTTPETIGVGTTEHNYTSNSSMNRSSASGRFTIVASQELEIQHYCDNTASDNGYGEAADFGVVEVYSRIEFWKVAE